MNPEHIFQRWTSCHKMCTVNNFLNFTKSFTLEYPELEKSE